MLTIVVLIFYILTKSITLLLFMKSTFRSCSTQCQLVRTPLSDALDALCLNQGVDKVQYETAMMVSAVLLKKE